MRELSHCVCLITGASSGIGRAFALELVNVARTLILVARRTEKLQTLRAELYQQNPQLEVLIKTCDLADESAREKLLADLRHSEISIDVLINNAGVGDIDLFVKTPWELHRQMINVNVAAPTHLLRDLLPDMITRGHGAVLNVSSGFGMVTMPLFSTYVGTKHFLSSLTEVVRAENAGSGVKICHLCPGPVSTEFESIANVHYSQEYPRWLEISAHICARSGLRGMAKNQALIQPGWLPSLAIWIGRLAPRVIMRGFMIVMNRIMSSKRVTE